ncbi:hypothetical protein CC86DRAFT_187887 [Ophiobolus disseminans]|uniref:Uncharacterized protein n=1 Tax=Ophiobolus disseminans TaxID=1469910 RepID=A0A6A7A911_9PLEO|nr:hypothetical protein CC86DRAFT_187887 [Ophiobolus disseminans]
MASWKIVPEPLDNTHVEYTPFLQSRKFYAVDDSGSTAGSILRRERAFVDAFQASYANPADTISLWGSHCDVPVKQFSNIRWLSRHGGTQPSSILNQQTSLDAIKASDVWFLLTDGEIWEGDVHRLADLALDAGVLDVPLVFLITGSPGRTPGTANISVGISFFASAQDTLILFKETRTGMIYVIAGKGCFAALGGSSAAQDLNSWDDLPLFRDEAALFDHFKQLEVQIVKAEHRTESGKGIGLGSEWEKCIGGPVRVDLDQLLMAGSLPDNDVVALLADEAFDTLAVAYKTRSRIAELRTFLQKQKIEQVSPRLEDVADAALIIAKMGSTTITDLERQTLQRQLREAHTKNREHYQKSTTDFAGSEQMQSLKKRNQMVDAALRTLAAIDAAGFNAEILSRKSNRARRAEVVDSVAAVDMTKLDLNAPACKGFCLVCCGEEEVMSICFKQPEINEAEDNTTDFALNFPLAAGASSKNINLVSSQNVCFQCALLAPEGRSIYNEDMIAIVPTLQYDGGNKKYINDQLCVALTAGLATGAAGTSQLFMAILQELLQSKAWAGAGLSDAQLCTDEQHEALQRRTTFGWMLDQLIQNTFTREDFKETGSWVKYPQALMWAGEDFEANGLASFAVTYPAAGFNNLLALGSRTGCFNADRMRRMKSAKVVHSIAAKYLAELQPALQAGGLDDQWRQKYLEVIYQDFNGPLVPKDQGSTSIVTSTQMFEQRLAACIGNTTLEDSKTVMRKVQLILFWLLFKHKGHCTAQTFFTRLRDTEPLATAVLDPKLAVPDTEARTILLSIFAIQEGKLINAKAAKQHTCLIPFANPFGASVLHCGADGCGKIFCKLTNPTEVNAKTVHSIRDARTKHLINVFGIATRFESSLTGLPERAETGHPPTSIHSNLHISIVREWAAHTPDQRRGIVADEGASEEFVKSVRRRLCAEGRGNIFQHDIDRDTRILLPSLFEVIAKALEMDGRKGADVAEYEHNLDANRMEAKIKWELGASRRTVLPVRKRVERAVETDDWEVL